MKEIFPGYDNIPMIWNKKFGCQKEAILLCDYALNWKKNINHLKTIALKAVIMAENLTKVPKRGILKASTSFEQREAEHSR